MQTYLRIKKFDIDDHLYRILDLYTLKCHIPDGSHAMRNAKDGENISKTYSFTKIFGPQSTQIDLFNEVVKPKLLNFINGSNYTLLTYGASGSGEIIIIIIIY